MPAKDFTWNYEDLIKLTNLTMEALYQHRSRGAFNPDSLGSVFLFIARHGSEDVKMQMFREAIARDKSESGKVKESRKKLKNRGL